LANALAYYDAVTIAAVKSFIIQATEVSTQPLLAAPSATFDELFLILLQSHPMS